MSSIELPDFRGSRLSRMFIIREVLEAGFTVTAESISQGFCVSLRTAYRDMKEIEAVGIPIDRTEDNYAIVPSKSVAWSIAVAEAWIARMRNLKGDEKANAVET